MLKLTRMNNRPSSRFSSRSSSSRSSPRLACRRAGRCRSRCFLFRCPSSLPSSSSSYRPCVSSCLSWGETNAVARVVGLFLVRMWGVVVLVLSPVPCLLIEGRGGVCVGVVDCPFCIYNSPAVCYSINVENGPAEVSNSFSSLIQTEEPSHPYPSPTPRRFHLLAANRRRDRGEHREAYSVHMK